MSTPQTCRFCGHKFSAEAKTCPQCLERHQQTMQRIFQRLYGGPTTTGTAYRICRICQ